MNRPFKLKARIAAGETIIGSWLSFTDLMIAEMMTGAGFDFLAVDMEHGHGDRLEMLRVIQIVELAGCCPLVRVASNDFSLIKQAMDYGAHGIIVPDIRSAAEARRAVQSMYYPPRGARGVGLARAHGFSRDFEGYRDERLPQAVLVTQIEHHEAVAHLDEILAVEGVDAFIIGPYDLSGSLGLPGKFDDPQVKALLDRAGAAAANSAKPGGYHIVQSDHQLLRRRINEGCRFMAYGTEMIFLSEKIALESAFVKTLRKS
jgi:2-dehydro-3-deoxyglucarate aldolase